MEGETANSQGNGRFGTLAGVFVPTTLTILGIILFLRTGWLVGNRGLLGAWLIIGAAYVISATTALSLSSLVTNMRVGAGGVFSVLSRTLGIELGGSIGVPLFLSQALAVAMYIFGFREGWRWIYPDHPAWAVDMAVFALVVGIAMVSARLAFRLQYLILAAIGVAIVSFLGGLVVEGPTHSPTWWRTADTSDTTFWTGFAVFFPAVTGIMAGANMSGELERPDRSIPRGTLWAIGLTFVIYAGIAAALSVMASAAHLAEDTRAMIELAAVPELVLVGLIAATFSSALATTVGAPRILQALAEKDVIWRPLGRLSKDGEPRVALTVTAGVIAVGVAFRSLNAIAELITLFFLLTYAMVNLVLLLQQVLGSVHFRPRFRLPLVVPTVGLLGCVAAMIAISPWFTVLSLIIVATMYVVLERRDLEGPFGDVHSSLLLSLSEWSVRAFSRIPASRRRVWQANLLLPVFEGSHATGLRPVLQAITQPWGSVILLGLSDAESESSEELRTDLWELRDALQESGISCQTTVVDTPVGEGSRLDLALEVLRGVFMRPNLLFLPIVRRTDPETDADLFVGWDARERFDELVLHAQRMDFGLCLHTLRDSREGPAHYKRIDVWFLDLDTEGESYGEESGLGLILLAAWKLSQAWGVPVRFLACVEGLTEEDARDEDAEREDEDVEREDEEDPPPGPRPADQEPGPWPNLDADRETVERALSGILESARIHGASHRVYEGDVRSRLAETEDGTLVLVGGVDTARLALVRAVIEQTYEDTLFICRSGQAG